MYVLFPDHGAFDRYSSAVTDRLSLDHDHILFIQKTRVGEKITQEQKLFFENAKGEPLGEKHSFVSTDHVLIIDDFTNSGGTLFGAVNLCNKMCESGCPQVAIFVSHLVATYDPKQVEAIKEKLHDMGPTCKLFTTNSIPLTTELLKDSPQVEVADLSYFIADLTQ